MKKYKEALKAEQAIKDALDFYEKSQLNEAVDDDLIHIINLGKYLKKKNYKIAYHNIVYPLEKIKTIFSKMNEGQAFDVFDATGKNKVGQLQKVKENMAYYLTFISK